MKNIRTLLTIALLLAATTVCVQAQETVHVDRNGPLCFHR
jgi:hypothetical protein